MSALPARPKCNPVRGRRPVLQNCTIHELGIDPAYQRSIENRGSQALIHRIARDWDWSLCQPLVVARRSDAGLFVVDGQHRLAAARMRNDIYDLPCVVTDYGEPAQEAAAFVELNQRRKPLGPIELFKASLAGGDREAIELMALIETAGLSLAPHTNFTAWKPGMVSNVAGIRAAYRKGGGAITKRALNLLARAFPDQVLRYGGTIFAGIWPALIELGEDGDDALMELVLQGDDQPGWVKAITAISADRGLHRTPAAIAAIREAYDEAAGEAFDEGGE
ncbi:DUF6551 family protein [Stakelama tenebrarum]|uniref:ParB N-terminal domain-containing protein n=1 Tax=Stakelama tenebrarum TaxID=2711215 RepID=A0A6G6Y547_9SPHN|nr:DUF6551 family protein [Sphingosinithalassobacter tenebrarum]QIG80074.1 ParB N-terminal domain-containing protein [Sphingosinithalassobacter tenebrarum]